MLDKQQIQSIFGKNLKQLRTSYSSISMQDLADAVNMTQPQIFNYENGKIMPSIYSAYRLAKVFGVTINDLIKE